MISRKKVKGSNEKCVHSWRNSLTEYRHQGSFYPKKVLHPEIKFLSGVLTKIIKNLPPSKKRVLHQNSTKEAAIRRILAEIAVINVIKRNRRTIPTTSYSIHRIQHTANYRPCRSRWVVVMMRSKVHVHRL